VSSLAYKRIDRIREEVKRELSGIIRELKDPRIPLMTTVVLVEVTKDLRYAKAYISVMGNKEQQKAAIEGLKSAAGFIRKEIGRRVQLRYTPEFSFVLDESIEHGSRISGLLHDIIPEEGEQADDQDD
jgi:ribosome-binding factor A